MARGRRNVRRALGGAAYSSRAYLLAFSLLHAADIASSFLLFRAGVAVEGNPAVAPVWSRITPYGGGVEAPPWMSLLLLVGLYAVGLIWAVVSLQALRAFSSVASSGCWAGRILGVTGTVVVASMYGLKVYVVAHNLALLNTLLL